MTNKYIHTILFLCFFTFQMVLAQEVVYKGDPDQSFYTARDLAFEGKRTVARDTLLNILSKYPDYNDVRNLLASTYSWDGDYQEARKHFNRITSSDRKNMESWVAAIKNEIYAKDFYIALGLVNKAMVHNPQDEKLIALRSDILQYVHKPEVKSAKINTTIDSSKVEEKPKVLKNRIAISNSYDFFDKAYDPMIYSSFEYKRETKFGSIIPRINFSNRFQTNGVQFELDAYPKISKRLYAYANYGFSNAPTFPNHRVGAEVYANLPKAMEVSIGMRYLDFNTTNANIFTASFGIYSGNYYFSARPYVTPSKNKPLGLSGTVLARKYLKSGEDYIGILAGYGFTSDLKQLRDGEEVLAETVLYVESQQLGFEYQFSSKKQQHLYKTNLGIVRQELTYDSGNFFWAISAGFTYNVKF